MNEVITALSCDTASAPNERVVGIVIVNERKAAAVERSGVGALMIGIGILLLLLSFLSRRRGETEPGYPVFIVALALIVGGVFVAS